MAKRTEICVLGELAVLQDGHPLALPPSKKTRALLGFLASCESPASRQKLCDLFWEGPDDPRAGLRWSLSKLRALLSTTPSAIAATGVHVSLEHAVIGVDVVQHRLALKSGVDAVDTPTLTGIAERMRGEFLEGLELPDCYRFEQWCSGQREALRRERIEVLRALVARLQAEPERALQYARACIEVDPLAEAGHIEAIELLTRLGRKREALAQYERCRRIVEGELGGRTSARLEQARMAISEGVRPTSAPPPNAEPAPIARPATPAESLSSPSLHGPFVGRARELAWLDERASAAAAGRAQNVLLLLGEPGIGKTRLLHELIAAVRARGGTALMGRAFEAEMVRPYGAWIEALRSVPLRGRPEATHADLAALLPELSDEPNPGSDRNRLFDAVAQLLRTLASAAGPALVVLDDVQWLDESSAALLHYVARAAIPGTLFALAARVGEIEDNASTLRLLRAWKRESAVTELELGPLSKDATLELVRAVAPHADAERVRAECEGHPLFAIELARARESLANDDVLPATLEELLRGRISLLDDQAQELLRWAAALGRSFELPLLGMISGLPTPALLSAVAELERRGLLRPAAAGTSQFGYDFTHDLVRRAAYLQGSEPRRRLQHAQIARVLTELDEPDDTLAGDIARHAALGGNDELAASACVRAGQRCLRVFAYAEALELSDRGRRHAQKLPGARGLAHEVDLLAIQVKAGAIARAQQLEQALTAAIQQADASERWDLVASAYHALAALQHHRGDLLNAAASAEQSTVAGRFADATTVVRALANAGRCYALVGRQLGRARELLTEAQALATAHSIEQTEIPLGLACLAHFHGDTASAQQLFDATLRALRRGADHWQECDCLVRMVMLEIDRDGYEPARQLALELSSVAQKMGGGGSEPQVAEALLALSELGGGFADARARVDLSIQKLRDIDTKGMLGYTLAGVARLELRAGEHASAAAHATEALEMAITLGNDSDAIFARTLIASAWLAAGDGEQARAQLREAEALARGSEAVSARAVAALDRARTELGGPPSVCAAARSVT